MAAVIQDQESLISQLRAQQEEAQDSFNMQIASFEQELQELRKFRDTSTLTNQLRQEQLKKKGAGATQTRKLINLTLKTIMQSESKPVIDGFIRRFKSMHEFDPFNQVPKLLKYT